MTDTQTETVEKARRSAEVQLRAALRLAIRDLSDHVSVPFRVDEIEALLSASAARDGWRTMESAPKDGSIVWVGSDGSMCVSYWTGENEKCWRNWYKGCRYRNVHLGTDAYLPEPIWFEPTHWQPLPAPPLPLAKARSADMSAHRKAWNGGSVEAALAFARERKCRLIEQGAAVCDECDGEGGTGSGVCIQCHGAGVILPDGGLRLRSPT